MAISKALVVDDSKLARISLRKQLQARGLEVEMVESGQDALNLLKESLVDVVFMDHLMPNMDGFEAMHAIKNNPVTQNIPVIMCTGKEDDGYLEEATANGAAGILAKPPAEDALTQALADAEAAAAAPTPAPAAPVEPAVQKPEVEKVPVGIPNFDPELIQQLQSQVASMQSSVSSLQQKMEGMVQQLASQPATSAESSVDTSSIIDAVQSQLSTILDSKIETAVANIKLPTPEAPATPEIDTAAIAATVQSQLENPIQSKIENAVANIEIPAPSAVEAPTVDTAAIASQAAKQAGDSLASQISNEVSSAVSSAIAKLELPAAAAETPNIDTAAIADQAAEQAQASLTSQINSQLEAAIANIKLPSAPAASAEIDPAIINKAVEEKVSALEASLAEQIQSQITYKFSQGDGQSGSSGLSEDRVKELALDIASEVVSQQPAASMSQQDIDAIINNATEAARSASEETATTIKQQLGEEISALKDSVSDSDTSSADTGDVSKLVQAAQDSASAAKIPGIIAILLAAAAIALKFINI